MSRNDQGRMNKHRGVLTALLGATTLVVSTLSVVPAYVAVAGPTNEPCDIYQADGTPCVAAFSSTRALYASYDGPLYQVQRDSDDTSNDIGLLSAGGYADAAEQDTFCANTTCSISKIYDQSANHNDLTVAPAGQHGGANAPADASALPITIAGHSAYGIYMPPGVAYRRSSTITTGTARGQDPESMYEVASGTNVNTGCCSDFGNAETQEMDTGGGHMDTINISTLNSIGSTGHGPWVQADLEEGIYQGNTFSWANNAGNSSKFVTAILKNNGVDTFALKGGNAQSGTLTTWYEGDLPDGVDQWGQPRKPMHLEGSIVLGAGGDNSNRGTESFFEGVMTAGYASNTSDDAVQANVVSQNYQAESTGGGPGREIVGPGGKCVDVSGDDTGGNLAQVQLWDCKDLAADQHWVGSAFGEGTINTLGRCLDIDGNVTTAGTYVELYDCNGADGQQWIPQADGSLKNPHSGLCLDDPSGNTANGTPLRIWTCNGAAAQKFAVTVPILHPVSGASSKCVDVAGNDVDTNGGAVELWDCQNVVTGAPGGYPEALDQQWSYDPATQTLHTLGRCLDIDGNITTAGTHVELWTCNGVPGQQWIPQTDGSMLNPASNLCLDDPNGVNDNGTPLRIWECNGAPAQQFILN